MSLIHVICVSVGILAQHCSCFVISMNIDELRLNYMYMCLINTVYIKYVYQSMY